MARTVSSATKNDIVRWASFIALLIVAVLFIINAFKADSWILNFIKDVAVVVAVGLSAHNLAKSLGQVWYIVYWCAIVLCVVGLIIGGVRGL